MNSSEVLVHVCCGPCMTGVYPEISKEKKVTGYFYNPNIHPKEEFRRRLMTAGFSASQMGFELIADSAYDLTGWLKVVGNSEDRCERCVYMRMKKTAVLAASRNFPEFTTTLLLSPYQDHGAVKEAGQRAAREEGVKFFYRDYRKNYQDSIKRSKEMFLYRQKYCGCIFSDEERGRRKK